MKSEHSILDQVSVISRIGLSPEDKSILWDAIAKHADEEQSVKGRRTNPLWQKRSVLIAGLVACLAISTGTVAWAGGVNVLNVLVYFEHNIKNGEGIGTGYSLENTTVNLSVRNSGAPSTPASSNNQTIKHASSTSALTGSANYLHVSAYNRALTDFVSMEQIPRMDVDGIAVNSIDAFMVDANQQAFYMFVNGYVPNTKDETIHLGLFHNTGGDVVIDGQTLTDVKHQINLSGIDATYIALTNNKTTLNYLTWKSGNWIFVLRSNNVPESALIQYGHNIKKQVDASNN